jgi:hypothetical protein
MVDDICSRIDDDRAIPLDCAHRSYDRAVTSPRREPFADMRGEAR